MVVPFQVPLEGAPEPPVDVPLGPDVAGGFIPK